MAFFQEPFRNSDLFEQDRYLQAELARRVPQEQLEAIRPRLAGLGRHTATTLPELSRRAEREPPVHVPWDPWGRRVDRIEVSEAWLGLKRFSAEQGLVAAGYDPNLGDRQRVVQAALLYLFSGSSAVYSCPLAMTDAAVRVLRESASPGLRDRLVPRLLATDPSRFWTSGQWMTERTGGSDVGATETVARPLGNGRYTLHGTKWFTSATTSEMALTLARIEDGVNPPLAGSRGLSLFCVEVRRAEDGGLLGIQVNRLKDKLGTRALPTAELTLDGVEATLLGPTGRGVARIATMLNVTRFYNAICSASGMARATFLAEDYAGRRRAFGKPLVDHPLHRRTLDELHAETAGALALAMEIADLLGREEAGTADADQRRRLRGLVPIAKLTLGKQAVRVASEALECFGGAGYVEDTGLPTLLRDAQVLSIWEGTTNVLSLDLLRAQGRDGSLQAVMEDLLARAEALSPALEEGCRRRIVATLRALAAALPGLAAAGELEAEARQVALTIGTCAEGVLLGETAAVASHVDPAAPSRFRRFVELNLMSPRSVFEALTGR